MIKPIIRFLGITAIVGCIASTSFAQQNQSASVELLAQFCEVIMKNHASTLNEAHRNTVDGLNRQLRTYLQNRRQARGVARTEMPQEELNQIIDELTQILTQFPHKKVITLQEGNAELDDDAPLSLPGDESVVLLQIQSSGEQNHFQIVEQDYSLFPENRNMRVSSNPTGTSWLLVKFSKLPVEQITIMVDLYEGNERMASFPLDIETPKHGRIKLSVLSDDTGQPTPAMIQLVWQTNGQDRKPSNAIEIAPQMDSQGSSSGRRMAQLPGNLAGPYWCVPEPFDMQLPPGEWEVKIRRGVEHLPVVDRFTIASGEVVEKVYQPKRWVDMRQHGWYSGDEHVHCQILSDDDACNLMAWVQAEDIHLANVVKMGDIYRTWFEQRGWGEDYRVVSHDTVLAPGQECPRTHNELGHTIHMNTQSMIRDTDQYFIYSDVFNEVQAQGGLSGFCHVLFNMFHVHRGMSINVPMGQVDFLELMQFNQMGTDLFYDFLNLGYKLTAAAGSDVPWGGTVGEVRMYAYIGDQPFDADAWFDAVEHGRTFVSNGPMIEFRVNDAIPGDELRVSGDETLRVQAKVWGHSERFVPSILEIVSQGEVIQTVVNEDNSLDTLTLDFELNADNGFWIAARLKGSDGSQAHTTPVYVVKENMRFWKYDAVEELVAARMASLDEVVAMVDDYVQHVHNGEGNYVMQQMEQQSDRLLAEVDTARALYNELLNIAIHEESLR